MIVIVDEDVIQLSAWAVELRCRGYEVDFIDTASAAYTRLSGVADDDIDLVLIDVMLADLTDPSSGRYSRGDTSDYSLTGVSLLDDLCDANEKVFPTHAAFLSMATSRPILEAVQNAARKHSVPFLRKSQFADPFEFGNAVEAIIQERQGNARTDT